MKDEKDEKEIMKTTGDLVKAPEAFKKDTKWCPWKESVQLYLNSQLNQVHILLAYIIWEQDNPIPGLVYSKVHKELVQGTVFYGTEFNANNVKFMPFCSH
jgi:hypothetical protein